MLVSRSELGSWQTWPAEIATTLDAHFGDKQGLEDQHINGGVPCLSLCLTSGTGKRYDAETETLIPTNGGRFVDVIEQPVTYDFFNITAPVNHQSRTPGDPCHTLARSNAEHAVVMGPQSMQVRRLTPRECERLQGFPDDYTDIKPKGKPTPDGPRYKALGNSWAVPVVRWIGKRIANELA